MRNKTRKMTVKIVSFLFIVILAFQATWYGSIDNTPGTMLGQLSSMKELQHSIAEIFIKDTVRAEQRRVLNNIRQAWIQYLNVNSHVELLLKENGKLIFKDGSGYSIAFDEQTMIKVDNNGSYTICDKSSGNVIGENMKPQWNQDTVNDIISIIANTVKLFNGTEGLIVFNVQTGEILLNNTSISDTTYDAHTAELFKEIFSKADTQHNTGLTALYAAQDDIGFNELDDFKKYPLGTLDRLFIEKVILPYESVGVNGLNMQIGIVSVVREKEIMGPYEASLEKYNGYIESLEVQVKDSFDKPRLSIMLSVFVMLLSLILIHVLSTGEDDA